MKYLLTFITTAASAAVVTIAARTAHSVRNAKIVADFRIDPKMLHRQLIATHYRTPRTS